MADTMQTLIERLEGATEGSRGLDDLIVSYFWESERKDPREWGGDPHARGFNSNATRFTTSLDASIPGENIVQVRRLTVGNPHGDRWRAVHFEGGVSEVVIAEGNTEALARRIAALKALSATTGKKE